MRLNEPTALIRKSFLLLPVFILCHIHSADASALIDEIRSVLSQKSLVPPAVQLLDSLDQNNLDATLRKIDPYSRYVPSLKDPGSDNRKTLLLGIEIFDFKQNIWIRTDLDGPAVQAGVPETARLLAVNGITADSYDPPQVSALIDSAVDKGSVTLTLFDKSEAKAVSFRITPERYPSKSFSWKMKGKDVLIQIREFVSHETAPNMAAVLGEAVKSGKRVIIDLRGCSGGDLHEALEVAGLFVPRGKKLMSTFNRDGTGETYRSPSGPKLKVPVYLLTDKRTASAAEILAGVLKYYRKAIVVGEKSVGKCVIQTLVHLSGDKGVWLTTQGIRLPDGSTCNGSGVMPDVVVNETSISSILAIMSNTKLLN